MPFLLLWRLKKGALTTWSLDEESREMSYNVIVPLDGSITAERAILPALELARRRLGVLRFVQVLPAGAEALPETREYLKSKVDLCHESEVQAAYEILWGEPFEILLQQAANSDVVVMSSHGRSGFDRFMLGSVAEKVVRRASCPILVVRSSAVYLDHLKRILVPLDGSDFSVKALPEASSLAQTSGATLVLARIVEPTNVHPRYVPEHEPQEQARQVDGYLNEVKSRVDSSIPVEIVHGFGSPSRVLLELAESQNIDLVVMATHGRSGLDRFFLGSVAENLLRTSQTPVLLVSVRD